MGACWAERKVYDLIIAGGGASAFAAALEFKNSLPQGRVLIIEKLSEPLKKVRASGNGRANMAPAEFSLKAYHSQDLSVAEEIFKRFSLEDFAAFFRGLGLPLRRTEEGFYPASFRAESLITVLKGAAARRGTDLLCHCALEDFPREAEDGLLQLKVRFEGEPALLRSRRVLLASGAKAQRALGSDASVLGILEKEGLRIEELYPALDALILARYPKRLRGCRLPAAAAVYDPSEKRIAAADAGEIIFNKRGVSGIPVMQMSASAYHLLHKSSKALQRKSRFAAPLSAAAADCLGGRRSPAASFAAPAAEEAVQRALKIFGYKEERAVPAWLLLDFLPQIQTKERRAFWRAQQERLGNAGDLLARALLPSRLADYLNQILKQAGRYNNPEALAELVNGFAFPLADTAGFEQAQVCGGGLSFSELLPGRLNLKRQPKVYASGEILDIYGDCGGYNLLWAWASGREAAAQIKTSLEEDYAF